MDDALAGPERRLAEELAEDGILLAGDARVRRRVVEELDHTRRMLVFEGRRPLYGAFVLHPGQAIDRAPMAVDLVALDHLDLEAARAYADGRSAFLVRPHEGPLTLACFDRQIQYEADLVAMQEATGADIVQRTAVLGAARLFTRGAVISWDGRSWHTRPTVSRMLPAFRKHAPHVPPDVARGVLDLAVHWLSPGHIGATLVIHDGSVDWRTLDTGTALRTPDLVVTNRRHFPALFASLQQHDLAVLINNAGRVQHLGVALRTTPAADVAVSGEHGMRHRSAQRFSFDQPTATVIVVSEDGPVTVFRDGQVIDIAMEPARPVPEGW